MSEGFELPEWPRALGGVVGRARFKVQPQDFLVEEQLGFNPQGGGEFLWLQLEKCGDNTRWVAEQLADLTGLAVEQIGYAGLKDRQAVTRQWFSLPLSVSTQPDWQGLEKRGIRLLAQGRHPHKLRRGDHQANQFQIRLRDLQADEMALHTRLTQIARSGFPNYFGPQRFGHDQGNLLQAQRWFEGAFHPSRAEQGFYLSAARALLFNAVLARRVEQGCWDRPLPGDLLEAADSGHCFPLLLQNPEMERQCQSGEITPTGPLYGNGQPKASRQAGELEQSVLADYVTWCKGLEAHKLRAGRRPLRARVADLQWRFEAEDLLLSFSLDPGAYATSLLRELLELL